MSYCRALPASLRMGPTRRLPHARSDEQSPRFRLSHAACPSLRPRPRPVAALVRQPQSSSSCRRTPQSTSTLTAQSMASAARHPCLDPWLAASQTQSASTTSWIQVDSMRQRPSLGISCYLKPEADPRNLPGNRRPGSTPSDPAALPCDRRRVRGLLVGEHDSRFPLLWKTATNILDLDLYGLLPSLLILSCHFLTRRRWSWRHARWCRWRCRRLMRRLRCVD
jgi:hypothetical protein